MRNYTLITPFTKQVTQDSENLQQNRIQFSDFGAEFNINLESDNYFIEKELRGYCNILSALSKSEKIYFLLPICFNEIKIIEFVEDFITACKYLTPKSIVFDKSRCDQINLFEKQNTSDLIEKMLEDSGLPITSITSSPFKKSNTPFYKTFNTEFIEKDTADIRFIYSKLHNIYDIKEAFYLGHYKRTEKQTQKLNQSFTKGTFSYTLN